MTKYQTNTRIFENNKVNFVQNNIISNQLLFQLKLNNIVYYYNIKRQNEAHTIT